MNICDHGKVCIGSEMMEHFKYGRDFIDESAKDLRMISVGGSCVYTRWRILYIFIQYTYVQIVQIHGKHSLGLTYLPFANQVIVSLSFEKNFRILNGKVKALFMRVWN